MGSLEHQEADRTAALHIPAGLTAIVPATSPWHRELAGSGKAAILVKGFELALGVFEWHLFRFASVVCSYVCTRIAIGLSARSCFGDTALCPTDGLHSVPATRRTRRRP